MKIRRGRGKQEGTQNMRYNVPVHQFGLNQLSIVPEPSMDHSSIPVEGGNSLCAMLKEKLKIKGLGAYGTLYSHNPISYSPSKSP